MDSAPAARPEFSAGPRAVPVVTSRFWRLFPVGMRRRWWLFRPFDVLARHWPRWGKPRGLLVIRMDGIGDMVLFRRALDHYAEVFHVPASEITVLGCQSWSAIAETVFTGFRVEVIDEHAFAKNLLYRFITSLRVARLNPAVTVSDSYFRRALMADSLAWIAAAPKTIASYPYVSERTRSEYRYYLSQVDEVIDTGPYPTHESVRHANFLSAVAGRAIAAEAPRLDWRDRAPDMAADGPYAVLNPGSNEYGRRWPAAHYRALAARLRAQGLRVIVVGKAEETGGADATVICGGDDGIEDLSGHTRLDELLDILRHAALVVSNDTGPAHLAIALGAPTVVIVGGGHFGCFVPYPDGVRPANARFVHEAMDCYHCFWRCHLRDDAKASFPCVAAVPVEAVEAACLELSGPDAVP